MFLSELYVISDDDPDPIIDWWIEDLSLYASDKEILLAGAGLSTAIIEAAQSLLHTQFPHLAGFQSTLLGSDLKFKPFSKEVASVQILNTGIYPVSFL